MKNIMSHLQIDVDHLISLGYTKDSLYILISRQFEKKLLACESSMPRLVKFPLTCLLGIKCSSASMGADNPTAQAYSIYMIEEDKYLCVLSSKILCSHSSSI